MSRLALPATAFTTLIACGGHALAPATPAAVTIDRLVATVASCPHGAALASTAAVVVTATSPGFELRVVEAPGSPIEGKTFASI